MVDVDRRILGTAKALDRSDESVGKVFEGDPTGGEVLCIREAGEAFLNQLMIHHPGHVGVTFDQ